MKRTNSVLLILYIVIQPILILAPAGQIPQKAKHLRITMNMFKGLFPDTIITPCLAKYDFEYPKMPISIVKNHPAYTMKGYLEPIDIYTVSNASASLTENNFLYLNNHCIQETEIKSVPPIKNTQNLIELNYSDQNILIITHLIPEMYGHFIFDILGSLALCEMFNVSYDYLYIPYNKKFMRELLDIWGIPQHKIIAHNPTYELHAKNIIFPSSVSRDVPIAPVVNYYHPKLLKYVHNKILTNISDLENRMNQFPKKIFISRKDSKTRNILNEDEIYELFKAKGYQRFILTDLSVQDQIALFHNATHIAGSSGSNMTNIIFCKPQTYVTEIMHVMIDGTFFVLASIFDLPYNCISDSTLADATSAHVFHKGREFDPHLVVDFLSNHPEL